MNIPEIKAIIELFETSSLSQLKFENKDLKIELTQGGLTAQVGAAGEPAPKASKPLTPNPPQPISKGIPVKAPLPGVFYRSEAPGAKPFVEVGQKVSKGETLCLIEAMKVMNEIPSPLTGTVVAILPENGELVSFEQALVEIEAEDV